MGVKIEEDKNKILIYGEGLNSLKEATNEIYLAILEQVQDY